MPENINEDWEELIGVLNKNKKIYRYGEEHHKSNVQFFQHSSDKLSICMQFIEWEIFLHKDGTWTLD